MGANGHVSVRGIIATSTVEQTDSPRRVQALAISGTTRRPGLAPGCTFVAVAVSQGRGHREVRSLAMCWYGMRIAFLITRETASGSRAGDDRAAPIRAPYG